VFTTAFIKPEHETTTLLRILSMTTLSESTKDTMRYLEHAINTAFHLFHQQNTASTAKTPTAKTPTITILFKATTSHTLTHSPKLSVEV
jgi:hypothetical protein